MRLHCLQHVPFEGPASIAVWAQNRGHVLSQTLLSDNDARLPDANEFDWLVVMGGPMSVYENREYPWLKDEKKVIEKAIGEGKVVLGVCLGAQLIADVLGGTVFPNRYKEIGWYPVSLTEAAKRSHVFSSLPDRFIAFHWHGDTFDLPSGCVRMASSEGCANQAFEYGPRVVGLQFHLESTPDSIGQLIQNCSGELVPAKYIQMSDEILSSVGHLSESTRLMRLLLNSLEAVSSLSCG